jgi:hypothetical protein
MAESTTKSLSVQYNIEGSLKHEYAKKDATYFGIQQHVYKPTLQGQPECNILLNRGFGKVVGTLSYGTHLYKTSDILDKNKPFVEKLSSRNPERYMGSAWAYEGDTRIFSDSIATEASSGMEDYYGFGHGFSSHASNALTGSAYKMNKDVKSWQVYRMRPYSPILFNTKVRMDQDHGDGQNRNYVPINANIVSFYYASGVHRKTRNRIAAFDTWEAQILGVYGPFKYSVTKYTVVEVKAAQTDKVNDEHHQLVSMHGIQIDGNGQYSQFTIKIPTQHRLITLRRTFDYRWCNQRAVVAVNGQVVGAWLSPGCNFFAPIKVDEFPIPLRFTDGQKSITVRIQNAFESNIDASNMVHSDEMITYGPEPKARGPTRYSVPAFAAREVMNVRQSWTELRYEVFVDK